MTVIPYKLSRRRLLVLFAFLVSSFLGFQPQSEPIAARDEPSLSAAQAVTNAATPTRPGSERRSNLGASYPKTQIKIPGQIPPVRIKVEKKQDNACKAISKLAKLGPLFPAVFNMSDFKVEGLVKGRWPIVIQYELEADSTAEVTITTTTNGKQVPFRIPLPPTNGERREEKRYLPATFGEKPQAGSLTFKALKNGPDPRAHAKFFLYGLGVGDKAVGSIVIGKLSFKPVSIRPKQQEKASYRFHSLSDFNSGSADFMLATYSSNVLHMQLAATQKFKDGVGLGESVTRHWDGKNGKGKISRGPHQFRVRAWSGLQSGGEWLSAFSQEVVNVE